jgi:hypothetical protein
LVTVETVLALLFHFWAVDLDCMVMIIMASPNISISMP